MFRTLRTPLSALLLGVALVILPACGGAGGGYYEPLGTVEVANLTAFDDVSYFAMAPAGSGAYTGDLLGGYLEPGFAADVGDFYEDFYDVEYEFNFSGFLIGELDFFVEAGFVNTFDVF